MHLKKERQINSSRIINNSFSSMNNNDSIDLDKPRHLTCIFVLIFEYFFPYIYMKRSNSFLFSSTMFVVIYSLPIFKKLSNRTTTKPNSSIQTEINYQKRYLFSFHSTSPTSPLINSETSCPPNLFQSLRINPPQYSIFPIISSFTRSLRTRIQTFSPTKQFQFRVGARISIACTKILNSFNETTCPFQPNPF